MMKKTKLLIMLSVATLFLGQLNCRSNTYAMNNNLDVLKNNEVLPVTDLSYTLKQCIKKYKLKENCFDNDKFHKWFDNLKKFELSNGFNGKLAKFNNDLLLKDSEYNLSLIKFFYNKLHKYKLVNSDITEKLQWLYQLRFQLTNEHIMLLYNKFYDLVKAVIKVYKILSDKESHTDVQDCVKEVNGAMTDINRYLVDLFKNSLHNDLVACINNLCANKDMNKNYDDFKHFVLDITAILKAFVDSPSEILKAQKNKILANPIKNMTEFREFFGDNVEEFKLPEDFEKTVNINKKNSEYSEYNMNLIKNYISRLQKSLFFLKLNNLCYLYDSSDDNNTNNINIINDNKRISHQIKSDQVRFLYNKLYDIVQKVFEIRIDLNIIGLSEKSLTDEIVRKINYERVKPVVDSFQKYFSDLFGTKLSSNFTDCVRHVVSNKNATYRRLCYGEFKEGVKNFISILRELINFLDKIATNGTKVENEQNNNDNLQFSLDNGGQLEKTNIDKNRANLINIFENNEQNGEAFSSDSDNFSEIGYNHFLGLNDMFFGRNCMPMLEMENILSQWQQVESQDNNSEKFGQRGSEFKNDENCKSNQFLGKKTYKFEDDIM